MYFLEDLNENVYIYVARKCVHVIFQLECMYLCNVPNVKMNNMMTKPYLSMSVY